MVKDIAIKVDNISKDFLLPHEKHTSLKSTIFDVVKGSRLKSKEKQHALKDISFEVKQGEFFGIVGRNGSGKSTLLKMLAGIYQPTKGKIEINGKLVPFIELGVGFNGELTGRENVFLNGAILGFSDKEISEMYEDIVEFAELDKFMDQKLKNYSSGMQVRLAFSLAIRANAEILLIDEVLAVGDAAFQRKCYDYFKLLKKQKMTVILVTHDMKAVEEYCDTAMIIDNGKKIMLNNTSKVTNKYRELNQDDEALRYRESTRWGNKFAKINYVKAVASEELRIEVKFTNLRPLEELIVGFEVEDIVGQKIFGSNVGTKPGQLKLSKGTTQIIEWQLPNILKAGKYSVNCALHNRSGLAYDWWIHAGEFTVKGIESTGSTIQIPEIVNFLIKEG